MKQPSRTATGTPSRSRASVHRLAAAALLALGALYLVSTAAAHDRARTPIRIPDVPGFVTLKCDFHMHTVFSDGEVWPTTRVEEVWRDGLDSIAITDHAGYNPHKQDVSVDLNRPYAIARGTRRATGHHLDPRSGGG